MIKGIIFDFDGLIVDTETAWYEAYRETLFANHAVDLDISNYSQRIGTGSDVLFQYFHEIVGTPVDFDQIENAAYEKFLIHMKEPVLREGVREYLKEAKQNNLVIGLASSSSRDWVKGYLEQLGILDYFDVIITGDDVSRVKPDPELYLKTLKEYSLLPSETIVFEDSFNGLTAAKQAGIRCVIVPNNVTRNSVFEQHDYRLNSMSEEPLRDIIRKLHEL